MAVIAREWKLMKKKVLSFEETDLTTQLAENFIVEKIPLFVVPCQTGASALRINAVIVFAYW